MNDTTRKALSDLLSRHGQAVLNDARRVEALLRDLLPTGRRDVNILMAVVRARLLPEISSVQGMPWEIAESRLLSRLLEEQALDLEAARVALRAWAEALGVPTASFHSVPPPLREKRAWEPPPTSLMQVALPSVDGPRLRPTTRLLHFISDGVVGALAGGGVAIVGGLYGFKMATLPTEVVITGGCVGGLCGLARALCRRKGGGRP